jgi:hypothetical protein
MMRKEKMFEIKKPELVNERIKKRIVDKRRYVNFLYNKNLSFIN